LDLKTDQALLSKNDNSHYIIEISKIYDLIHESNKFKFKIKTKNTISFSGTETSATLDVMVGNNAISATCTLNNGVNLECEASSTSKTNLIKLHRTTNYVGKIQISELKNYGIPLKISLQFNKAYDLKYDEESGWSFMLETTKGSSDSFHKSSTFSVDIKINGDGDELAFCTQSGNIVSNKLILLCMPENKASKNDLISLNSQKSDYSSITWTNTNAITEGILISGEINNKNVGKKRFNQVYTNKWSFEMNVYDEYPINSVIKIDLVYNGQKTTATCTFSAEKKFICSPDVDTQTEEDTFTISPNKELGSVTFKDNEKISFNEYVKYLKAYDLKFITNVWQFKIEVESNLEDGNAVTIGVNVDNSPTTANCLIINKMPK
jgi:hypothetical protein